MIVALSALLISVVTTIVGVYSAYIDRAYARASVWPRIEIARTYDQTNFKYVVTNAGTGPAIIKHAKIKYKSKPIKQWREIPELPNDFVQSHLSSKILPSQHTIYPLQYTDDLAVFLETDKFVDITLCYCSIYDECWQVDRESYNNPVDSCKVEESERFLQ